MRVATRGSRNGWGRPTDSNSVSANPTLGSAIYGFRFQVSDNRFLWGLCVLHVFNG